MSWTQVLIKKIQVIGEKKETIDQNNFKFYRILTELSIPFKRVNLFGYNNEHS